MKWIVKPLIALNVRLLFSLIHEGECITYINKYLIWIIVCEWQLKETREQVAQAMRLLNQRDCAMWDTELPVIYAITPTYARPVQKAELTRFLYFFVILFSTSFFDLKLSYLLVSSLVTNRMLPRDMSFFKENIRERNTLFSCLGILKGMMSFQPRKPRTNKFICLVRS